MISTEKPMLPDDIGNVTKQAVDDQGFAFYASSEFWLGKAAELNLAAEALAANSFQLIANRIGFASEIFGIPSLPFPKTMPFPPDPRIGAGVWQTMMMAGFALENIFKAIAIQVHPAKITKGRLENFHHRLVDLSQIANISLSELEQRLCEICTHATLCAGRYPTSKDGKDLAGEWRVDIELAWPVYQALYSRCFSAATGK